MNERPVKIIKQPDRPKSGDDNIKRHELSLLSLLVEKYPERAKEFLERSDRPRKTAA